MIDLKLLDSVQGWFDLSVVPLIERITYAQRGITGSIIEIGVHHGRSLIPMALGQKPGEVVLAIDCWDQQQHNRDKSGKGDLKAFINNLQRMGIDPSSVKVLSGDSMEMTADSIREITGGQEARLFSVDGSHTPAATLNDLWIAARTIGETGIVMIDDVFNPSWPGVQEGFRSFMSECRHIKIFTYAGNRLFLCWDHRVGYYTEAVFSVPTLGK